MKKYLFFLVLLIVPALIVIGCGAPQTKSSSEAISVAQQKPTVQAKVDYLVAQAKGFLNSKNYEEAMSVAQHILSNLDATSTEAKEILAKAQEEFKNMAKGAVDDMKNKLGSFGK
jgi:hypothetical protein